MSALLKPASYLFPAKLGEVKARVFDSLSLLSQKCEFFSEICSFVCIAYLAALFLLKVAVWLYRSLGCTCFHLN